MSQRKIWLIVALMSSALVGITMMQVTWIRNLIELNAANFDEQVFSALNKTSDRLMQIENRNAYANGYSIDFFESRKYQVPQSGVSAKPSIQHQGEQDSDEVKNTSVIRAPFNLATYQRYLQYSSELQNVPLGSRIQPSVLDTVLRQEMANYGINADFAYGVFSRELRDFIIVDGKYFISDRGPTNLVDDKSGSPGASLETSRYAVALFNDAALQPLGLLIVTFPDRTSIVLGSVWLTILVSGVLLLIVLACFAYSIFIIFQQKRLSRMKNDFISNMTHEFKTPIATISLAVDSMTNQKIISSPDKLLRFAGIIKAENQRMNRQVEKVLQAAQIERGDMKLKSVEIDVNQLAREAADHMALQIDRRGGNLQVQLEAKESLIVADRTHLSNVIHNLLDNAIKYSPDQLEITLRTEDTSKGVRVLVRDCGIGMTNEDQRQIFDSFFRVHTGNRHDVKGFGLGLSYVKASIEAHGGTVGVESTLGRGSTFYVELPRKPAST